MYTLILLRTAAVLEWTTDKSLIHEWAERWSRGSDDLYAVKWSGSNRFTAVYRNGQLVEYRPLSSG